MILIELYSMLI